MPATRTDYEALALAEYGPLRRAERMLLRACATGDIARVGLRRPMGPSADVSVRAALIAFIVRSGLSLPHRRLQLLGGFIEGRLDLGDAAIPGSLWFYRCTFDSPVLLDGAQVAGAVTLAGCRLPRLLAEGCRVATDLVVNAGCIIDDDVRLRRARIGGQLDCSRLDLRGGDEPSPTRRALLADGIHVAGDVKLTDGFQAIGEVRFLSARVEGDFRASGHFTGNLVDGATGGRAPALLLDRIEVGGSVRFDEGFGAAGRVGLRRARIGGDLDATGASFDRLGDAAWSEGAVLMLDRACVDGALVLRELQAPLVGASFVGAQVGTLADDATTWGARLALDGFSYEQLGEDAPLDTVFRVDWLERQEPTHLHAQFRVQPWRRLIRVLRRMGHEHRAASIALRREQKLRHAGRVGDWAPAGLRWVPRAGHALLGMLAGYGYRPARLVGWMAAVWLLCGAAYWAAALHSAPAAWQMAPTQAGLPLDAFTYSLGRLLPLVDLGPAQAWSTGSTWADALHWLSRFESAFGWLAALLLLASVAGWVDRDRRT